MKANAHALPPVVTGSAPSAHARPSTMAAEKAKASFASELGDATGDHLPPSRAARAALIERPDLADRPFGSIVSLFARGEELPLAEAEQPEPPAEPEADPVTTPVESDGTDETVPNAPTDDA